MEDWEKLIETSLPDKQNFSSHLKMEDIANTDYTHTKRFCKAFKIKQLGEYHGLYVQSNTLLLFVVFESFWNMSLEIYNLDHGHFCTAPALAW